MSQQIHDIGGRRAWAIWMAALAVYVLAVFHRSSLGVAGLLAADRFDISATRLAFFTVMQLLVYAAMQVPVGVMLDRYGSRRMLLTGLVMMTAGQFAFAFGSSFAAAVASRAVLGAGDAMVFTAVIRLVVIWFAARQTAMITQLTGLFGQLGAIMAAAPLSLALRELGWTRAFALTSSLGLVVLVAVALLVKDSPFRAEEVIRVRLRELASSIRSVWGNPGTRLGMWNHFTAPFAATSFAMLWGFPFLVRGQGWSEPAAANLLMAMTGWGVVSALLLGVLTARLPYWRSIIVIAIVVAMALCWALVLGRDTPAPVWLMVLTTFVTASGGPAALVGFDLARTFTPVHQAGRVNGIVNVGGFAAALCCMALIGVVLDLLQPGGMDAYDLGDFRVAMCVPYVFWVLGVAQMLRYRRKSLDHLRRLHPGAVEQMRRGEPFVHPGFHDREGV